MKYITKYLNYDSYLIFRPRGRIPQIFPKKKTLSIDSIERVFFFQIPVSALILLKEQTFLSSFSHYIDSTR